MRGGEFLRGSAPLPRGTRGRETSPASLGPVELRCREPPVVVRWQPHLSGGIMI